ncbi:hypothetical protein M3Y98_00117600 [Aphelenchoides besseyi]|nr:hypothetical protein M3Y98_00117600 [Aphelenchoides besseyi]KAI6199473.1 hypothetical protein M3Y96_00630900 [Aphelenchoides besseyi]
MGWCDSTNELPASFVINRFIHNLSLMFQLYSTHNMSTSVVENNQFNSISTTEEKMTTKRPHNLSRDEFRDQIHRHLRLIASKVLDQRTTLRVQTLVHYEYNQTIRQLQRENESSSSSEDSDEDDEFDYLFAYRRKKHKRSKRSYECDN